MGRLVRLIVRLLLLPLVCLAVPIMVGWAVVSRKDEPVEAEDEIEYEDPTAEHDDGVRRWAADMSPMSKLKAVEKAFSKQEVQVEPVLPFHVWAAQRKMRRR